MIIDIRKIYVEIKNRIIDLTYPPNTLIKEEALAEEYNISRTPVRSVISRLVQRGLLVVKPKKGTYVSPISIKMIDNETIRKASEMGIIDVINAVNTVESNTTYITLSFDEKIKMIIDMVYQCRYNEAVKKLKKRAKLRYLEADLRDVK